MFGVCSRAIQSFEEEGRKGKEMFVLLVSRYINYILRMTTMTPVNYLKGPTVAKACSKALKSC